MIIVRLSAIGEGDVEKMNAEYGKNQQPMWKVVDCVAIGCILNSQWIYIP